MSLKAFHIFFLFVSTILFIGLEFWGIRHYLLQGEPISLVLVGGTFVGCVGLIGYATWFIRKYKNISYL